MKKNKLALILSSILIIYSILGFVAVPKIVKPIIIDNINANITQKASLEKVSFNPFLLTVSLENLKIQDKEETTFSIDSLTIDFNLFRTISERHLAFQDLQLVNPYIHVIENEDKSFNLEKLVKPSEETTSKEETQASETTEPIKFQIYKTAIQKAKIKFTKLQKDKKPFVVNIKEFNYTFYDMGTFRNILASHSLDILINKHTRLDINGGLRVHPFHMYGNVKLSSLRPSEFLPYKEELFNFKLTDETNIDLAFGYNVDTKKELDIKINNLDFALTNLNIMQNKHSTVYLKALKIQDLNLNYPENNLDIQAFTLEQLNTKIIKDKKEVINLTKLVNIEEEKTSKKTEETKVQTETSKPWKVNLANININNTKVLFDDQKALLSTMIKDINLQGKSLKVNNKDITLEELSLKNSLDFKDTKNKLEVSTLNNSFSVRNISTDTINNQVSYLDLKSQEIKVSDKKSKTYITTKNFDININEVKNKNQDVEISKVSLNRPTILIDDKKTDKKISINKLLIDVNKIKKVGTKVTVDNVKVNEPSFSFKDNKAKTDIQAKDINLLVNKITHNNNELKIVSSSINKPFIAVTLGKQAKKKEEEKKKVAKKTVAKKEKSNFSFDIGPVKIKNAQMVFQDKNLPIPFKTNISKLHGDFSRLHSSSSKPTKLQLEGKVDKYGYTKITGTVDINDIKLLTDTTILFKNIAIKNFTPYSGKFVGREIDSGKLNLDLKYNIRKSNLDAKNSIIISDIKLGKQVQSEDAANLPLDLAIALLENSDGVIDLELPITGNVDDPQFAIAPIVWKVFTNLIVKAISSPFTLLASVLGIEADEIKSIDFEYGNTTIIASEKEALDNIAKILAKKKRLAINVSPSYHQTYDTLAIQDKKFDKFLEKRMKKIVKGDEYKEALEDLFEETFKDKDLDDIEEMFEKTDKKGKKYFDNKAYVEYLRKTLASLQKVSTNELETLAKTRSQNILDYLIKEKKVEKNAIVIDKKTNVQIDEKDKWSTFNLSVSVKK
ncbi:hypothetical protein CRV03_11040 [Arcobacter sp. F155]|uniref:DUF748 domain-containing protein n=1 Tax=Arcobacter sp. F155 TaxID=2044512 RepID=UPI00100AC43F|nr:DUF748 domain-containing protein [Arcobacter sp. F155]RXJ76013.1 hypothetical protein CRV03_11040 [Arcobacter sp. F155]